MKHFVATAFLALFFLSLSGCPAAPTDAVSGQEQSAIEAYQAAEAEEQAALEAEMEEGIEP